MKYVLLLIGIALAEKPANTVSFKPKFSNTYHQSSCDKKLKFVVGLLTLDSINDWAREQERKLNNQDRIEKCKAYMIEGLLMESERTRKEILNYCFN